MIHQDVSFLKSIRDPLIIVDKEFRILYVNDKGAAIYGKSHHNLIGKTCFKEFHNADSACIMCPIEPVLVNEKTSISEKWITLPDGQRKCGEIRSYPVLDAKNKVVAVTSIVVDITEKKQAESKEPKTTDIKFSLSKREIQILELISRGYTNPEISEELSITINTVKTHVNNIFNKIGVSDRTQAAIIALKSNCI